MMKQLNTSKSSTIKLKDVDLNLFHACQVGDNKDGEIFVSVRTLEQLFADPEPDPWSNYEVELMGQSGFLMAIRHFEIRKLAQPYVFRALIRIFTVFPQYFTGGGLPFDPKRLIVSVPADVMKPDLAEEMKPVVDNFFLHQIDDLKLQIKRERSLQMHLLIGGICMFVLFMWLWWVLLYFPEDGFWTESFSQAFNVFAWIVIWDPWEALLFNPIDKYRKIRAYKLLIAMDLEFRLQKHPDLLEEDDDDADDQESVPSVQDADSVNA